MTGTLHEDRYTFLISLSVFLRMRNVSDKSCRETQNTHFMSNKFYFIKRSHLLQSRAGHRWQYNTVHAQCMPDT